MDFSKLDDKRVLITGSAGGIGLALARAFHSGGARVFLTDVAGEKLARIAPQIGAVAAACDVTQPDAIAEIVDRAWREIGPIDLLCANAGVVTQGPLLEARREELDWIFDVNVWGILNACRPYVRMLRESGREGHILMTGSETSLSYPAFTRELPIAAYLMTKHCVLAMAEGLRAELARDRIGVSVLCPGPVPTDLAANSGSARRNRAADAPPAPAPELSPEMLRSMASLQRSADEVAATALAGLRRGLFVIPTHPHTRGDVAQRHAEIERGLDALGSLA